MSNADAPTFWTDFNENNINAEKKIGPGWTSIKAMHGWMTAVSRSILSGLGEHIYALSIRLGGDFGGL